MTDNRRTNPRDLDSSNGAIVITHLDGTVERLPVRITPLPKDDESDR